jgi:hypothetical protein
MYRVLIVFVVVSCEVATEDKRLRGIRFQVTYTAAFDPYYVQEEVRICRRFVVT